MPKAADFSAIYGIRHIASGRIYVGSAVRTNARWRQHRSQLQRGTHHSRYLQAAWSKNRIAEANRRRTLSPETKAKISAARKRNEEMKKKSQEPLMGYELRTKLADS